MRKAHPTESFFNFFSPPVAPSEEAIETEEIDEEELDELEEKLEIDYQIGEDIKEKVRSIWPSLTSTFLILYACLKVIPRAIDYFTGKALEYDMLSEDDDDYEDEEDDDDDDDVDGLDGMVRLFFSEFSLLFFLTSLLIVEEDSDEDLPPMRRGARRGGRGGRGRGPPAPNVNPEECKQQ